MVADSDSDSDSDDNLEKEDFLQTGFLPELDIRGVEDAALDMDTYDGFESSDNEDIEEISFLDLTSDSSE